MRFFSMFLGIFLFLLFTGTVSYVYMLWHHYRLRIVRLEAEEERGIARLQLDETTGRLEVVNGNSALLMDDDRAESSDSRQAEPSAQQIDHYEKQILSQLRNAVVETGRSVQLGEVRNAYSVAYNGSRSPHLQGRGASASDLVCDAVAHVTFETFLRGDKFFSDSQRNLDRFFPGKQLYASSVADDVRVFETCGIVSSAGSLSGSHLGAHIDSNELVIRFNNAPSGGSKYRVDVGSRTSLRIVNSQVVSQPQFGFLESRTRLFSHSAVLVWDPSAYNASLEEWYARPDQPFFETFFTKRLMRPREDLFLLHPAGIWSLWNWLQYHNKYPLLPNPPSSGFLGLMLALKHCKKVHMYEFVPSMRLTKRCHYYDEEENFGCTIGDWHPLAAEKLMALAFNVANSSQVFVDGYLTIPGAPSLSCNKRLQQP